MGSSKIPLDILLVDINPAFPPIPPLGLEVLGSVLEREDFTLAILSASPYLSDYSQKLDHLRRYQPRTIGLQIRNYDLAILRQEYPTVLSFYQGVASRLRSRFPRVPLILGGMGFAMAPEFWLRQLAADYGIISSGEVPLVRLLQVLLRKEGKVEDIPNLALSDKPGQVCPDNYMPHRLARVRRNHVDFSPFLWYAISAGCPLPWANIEIQRGCRYRCDFCVEPRVHGRKVVFKEVADVVAEIEAHVDMGITDFFFCNSEFNLNLDRCFQLCDALMASGLGQEIRWWTYLIPNCLPLELACAMKRAGCHSVSFNAVHVNDAILSAFHCPHRRVHYERGLEYATTAGLQVSNTFLLGSALETQDTVRELMAFIDRRGLWANLSLGIAHYPNLPESPALAVTSRTKIFSQAGNGTVPYSLQLSDGDVLEIIEWAAVRENVHIGNGALAGLPEYLRGEECHRLPAKAPSGMNPCDETGGRPHDSLKRSSVVAGQTGREEGNRKKADFSGRLPGISSHEKSFYEWIKQAASGDNRRADEAVRKLRAAIPLLDLPEVQLGHELPIPAPIAPDFLLYAPYRKLSIFYQDFLSYLRHSCTDPAAISRLLLRLFCLRGEFPRMLQAAKPYLEPDALALLMGIWQRRNACHQLVFATSYACQSGCPYCYAKDVEKSHPGELTLENFWLALEWAARQDCQVISFVGGEPTLHPLMKEFLRHVHDSGMRTYFNSNLLCEPEVLAQFDREWVLNIGIHAQAHRYTRPDLRSHFERNVAFLQQRDIFLFLRYNFEYRNQAAIDDAIALAQRLKVAQVSFAIPMPSLSRRNRHAVEAELLASGEFLVQVVEKLRAAHLKPVLTKPIPPCALPEDRLEFLRADEALLPACNLPKRNWTQNVLVGPDLTISTCTGVSSRGPSLLSFRNFEEISHYVISRLRKIVRPTPFAQCHTCNFYLDRRCLGGCLAYFTDGSRPADSAGRSTGSVRKFARPGQKKRRLSGERGERSKL